MDLTDPLIGGPSVRVFVRIRNPIIVADTFDPYREALVVETATLWTPDMGSISLEKQADIAQQLHADATRCVNLEYIRVPTGFCRRITVTAEDVARVVG